MWLVLGSVYALVALVYHGVRHFELIIRHVTMIGAMIALAVIGAGGQQVDLRRGDRIAGVWRRYLYAWPARVERGLRPRAMRRATPLICDRCLDLLKHHDYWGAIIFPSPVSTFHLWRHISGLQIFIRCCRYYMAALVLWCKKPNSAAPCYTTIPSPVDE